MTGTNPMDSGMVERVARAIMCARDNGGCEVGDWRAEERDNPHVAQALRQARAAIEAMREPTEAMLNAGRDADWVGYHEGRAGRSIMPSRATLCDEGEEPGDFDSELRRKEMLGIWPAMIDAALTLPGETE